MYRTRFAYPSTHQWTRAASALGPLGYGPPCTVRGRAVDGDIELASVKTFGAGTVLFLTLKPEFGLYETGRPCKVGLLVPVCPGRDVGAVLLHHALFSPGCSDECVPGPHIPTLHGEPDSGQDWLESCFTPRPSATLICGLWPQSSVAPERGRRCLELMLASQDVDVVTCRNASGALLAVQQGRTRGCRVWRAGRVGGFLSSWVLEAGPGEGGFLLPASSLSPPW